MKPQGLAPDWPICCLIHTEEGHPLSGMTVYRREGGREIDAEDLMAHYNLMLCYKGLGREEDAEAEQQLYEKWLGAAGEYIVDAVINYVNTDCIVPGQGIGNLQLGAYRVSTGDQHRFLISLELKKPAEESHPAQDFGAQSGAGMLAD